ncbi:MAG: hypothetical protein K2K60_03405 [Clostridia bacterium]|nr:hypothetical protein [Clostridia bacterium]
MKKNSLLLLLCVIIGCSFMGCASNKNKQRVYNFGETYEFENFNVRVENNFEKERFEFYYVDKGNSVNCYFCVEFTYQTTEAMPTLLNSTEFKCIDSDCNEIVFNENRYYVFTGNKTLYISYKNATEEIKLAIEDANFSISFGFGYLVPNK